MNENARQNNATGEKSAKNFVALQSAYDLNSSMPQKKHRQARKNLSVLICFRAGER
jgi:hypothetical protein